MQHTDAMPAKATQWILALRLLKQWLQNALQDFVLRLAPSIVKSKAKAAAQRLSKAMAKPRMHVHAASCCSLPLPRFRSVAAFACLHARDLRPGEGCL
jgi:hypothetical protein